MVAVLRYLLFQHIQKLQIDWVVFANLFFALITISAFQVASSKVFIHYIEQFDNDKAQTQSLKST